MADPIRAFVAIKPPAGVVDQITALQKRMADGISGVRWVGSEGIHLTLKFLGDIDRDRVETVGRTLVDAVAGMTPFLLTVKGVGVFPSIQRPRVIWAGAAAEAHRLYALQQAVEEGLETVGFARERRRFRGHLTLGRVKGRLDSAALMNLLHREREFFIEPFPVAQITLYQSRLKPSGAEYTSLVQAPLAGRPEPATPE
ncbi:MAG TPA: RNA 2',3'-cyclic phosphodiesterase [Desulfobacterales bacterium]